MSLSDFLQLLTWRNLIDVILVALIIYNVLLLIRGTRAVQMLFGLLFVTRGVGRVDPAAASGTWGFRVLILPGAAALWPPASR